MSNERDSLVRDFKNTFSDEAGTRVLANLKIFCRANNQQGLFDPTSDRQTSYNLGAHAVFRYIQTMIDENLTEIKPDCEIENQERTKQ